MSGPTATQTELGQAQLQAYQTAATMTAAQYAQQQAIYGPMVSQFQSIYAKGPNQEGFSQDEENDLNSEAIEGTAENYKNAATAVGEETAAEGGGSSSLPTGGQTELKEQTADSAAANLSNEQEQIKQAGYTQGYSEWEAAGSGLGAIATGENPEGFESNETSAGSAAASTAATIASEDDSWINAAIGAGGTVAGMATGASINKFG